MMAKLLYLGSLIVSIFSMVMTILLAFVNEESNIWRVFGYKEDYICVSIAAILLILGFINDREERHEEEF